MLTCDCWREANNSNLTFHHEPFKRPLGGDGRQLTLGTDGRGMPSADLS